MTNPVQYELIDRYGRIFGPYPSMEAAAIDARKKWPDQEQDVDRIGVGWDVRCAGEPEKCSAS